MTRNQKLIKNTGNWILIIILLLLCGILVFHLFSFTGMSHRLFAKQIQKVVLKEDAILQQAKQNHQTLQDLDNLPNTIGAYVYNRDSLLYWNSNVIDPDLLRKRVKMDCDTIVNLNVGDFLVTSFEKDSCSFFFFKLLNTTYPIENKYFVNRFQPIWGKHKVYFDANPQPESYQITTQTGKLLSNCSIEFPSGWGSSNLSFLIVCVALMILCFYLLTSRFITRKIIDKTESHTKPTKKAFIGIIAIVIAVTALALYAFGCIFHYGFQHGFLIPASIRLDNTFLFLFIAGLALVTVSILFVRLLKPWLKKRNELFVMIAQFVFWGILLTILYDREYNRYENHEIEQYALELSNERDLAFEQSYPGFLEETVNDTVFLNMLCSDDVMEEIVLDYMRKQLLDSVMNQYVVSLTLCLPEQELFVQPYNFVTDCQGYFNEKVAMNHGLAVDTGLYFMDYNTLDPNYLAYLTLSSNDTIRLKGIYVEFTKPVAPQGFGFPKMLQDDHNALLLRSSAACYRDSLLVYKFGSFVYPNYLSDYKHPEGEFSYGKKLKHYVYRVDERTVLALSVNRQGWMERTAPFVFFFFLLLVLYLLIYFVGDVRRGNTTRKTLSNRFQVVVLGALGISFILIGPVSGFYLQNLYAQKADQTHFDRTRTLSLDMIGEIDFSFLNQHGFKNALDEILRRYSETFFTDINIYDINGKMLSTTCPELIDLQIQSSLMNAEAFHNMNGEKSLYYIHEEQLGKAVYQSSYIAIQDNTGKTLAYLNIPYFSSKSDLQNEILYYILTYVNIILLIIFVFIPIVLLITRRMTDPLEQLQEKMREVDINKSNEKLEWKSEDEIGALINQYNQLIVALEESAVELKRTTTESAWRGVARQVAHEIKNSLTPMRLSIQLLQRNMDNNDPDLENKMRRTTATLIEQIDALSDIASSFSRYAKLPENHLQPLDLVELIGNLVNLYDNIENIEFHFNFDPMVEHTYNGDKTNLNSAIGNIIKNATQAIGTKPNGKIDVTLQSNEKYYVIAIKDNGKGIKEEDKKMIFVPNFTTKTGGSGIGLSLTYSIIQSVGGFVTFESEEGVGTEFVIKLPK